MILTSCFDLGQHILLDVSAVRWPGQHFIVLSCFAQFSSFSQELLPMPAAQQFPSFMPWWRSFIIISCLHSDFPGMQPCENLQIPPAINPIKTRNPTTRKNQDMYLKNLPSSSFFVFANSRVPARIVSNETASKCIILGFKIYHSGILSGLFKMYFL